MEKPTKQNSLYLTIKQVYFDQIVAGTKTEEYREISPNTYKKYLQCDSDGYPLIADFIADEELDFYGPDWIMACKDGKFPFFFRTDIQFLNLAVGYSKVRDTATVEVTDITPLIAVGKNGREMRMDLDANDNFVADPKGRFCMWQAVFHLGKVVEKNIVSKQ